MPAPPRCEVCGNTRLVQAPPSQFESSRVAWRCPNCASTYGEDLRILHAPGLGHSRDRYWAREGRGLPPFRSRPLPSDRRTLDPRRGNWQQAVMAQLADRRNELVTISGDSGSYRVLFNQNELSERIIRGRVLAQRANRMYPFQKGNVIWSLGSS